MRNTSTPRILLAAGLIAAAGFAQAQTTDAPQQAGEASTMTNGAPNQATTNSPYSELPSHPAHVHVVPGTTVVMGAAPVYVTPYPYTYSYDATDSKYTMSRATATTNVPGRAGEASTMTNGAPNLSTNN